MKAYLCRWPNANFSLCVAASEAEVLRLLDAAFDDACMEDAPPGLDDIHEVPGPVALHLLLGDNGLWECLGFDRATDKHFTPLYPHLYPPEGHLPPRAPGEAWDPARHPRMLEASYRAAVKRERGRYADPDVIATLDPHHDD